MESKTIERSVKWLPLAGLTASAVLCAIGWQKGIFASEESLNQFISSCGSAGMLVFIAIQMIQVVIPILPGGISCLVGVVLFGAWRGFLFNYIGICLGSVIAFLVARIYGEPLIKALFGDDKIERYQKWTEKNNRFTKLFALAIFFPVAPDDFLCYLAGTTKMRLSHFTAIILLCKPFAIALYSLGLTAIFNQLTVFLSA